MIPKEIKYNLHYDDVRRDFLWPLMQKSLSDCRFQTLLTLKVPSKIRSRQHYNFFFCLFIYLFFFLDKTSLDISCELSAWQTVHMKCQNLFSAKNQIKSKIAICSCASFTDQLVLERLLEFLVAVSRSTV